MEETNENQAPLTPAEEIRIQIEKSKEAGEKKFIPAVPEESDTDLENNDN